MNDGDAMTVLRFVEVMRRDQHGDALARQLADEIPELPARERIDAAGGFVEKDDGRLVEDGAAERQPLPPAAGQIARQRALAAFEPGHLAGRTRGAPRSASPLRP